jgi:hypothetical protein
MFQSESRSGEIAPRSCFMLAHDLITKPAGFVAHARPALSNVAARFFRPLIF